jgi:hypothetical protein
VKVVAAPRLHGASWIAAEFHVTYRGVNAALRWAYSTKKFAMAEARRVKILLLAWRHQQLLRSAVEEISRPRRRSMRVFLPALTPFR